MAQAAHPLDELDRAEFAKLGNDLAAYPHDYLASSYSRRITAHLNAGYLCAFAILPWLEGARHTLRGMQADPQPGVTALNQRLAFPSDRKAA